MAAIPSNLDPALFESSFLVNGKGLQDKDPPPRTPRKRLRNTPKAPRKIACHHCNFQHKECVPKDPAIPLSTCERCANHGLKCEYSTEKQSNSWRRLTREQIAGLFKESQGRLFDLHFPFVPQDEQERNEFLDNAKCKGFQDLVRQSSQMSEGHFLAVRSMLALQMIALITGRMRGNAARAVPDADSSIAASTSAPNAFAPTTFASNSSATTDSPDIPSFISMALAYASWATTNLSSTASSASTTTVDNTKDADDADDSDGTSGDVDMED